ncbi:hypothetical protein [Amycolatopsis rubida]|uniref:Uncharacterized protein n=1 Tax=Amycolatopsis rubida TaxID=112413 RepID=A0A1I5XI14_9PSEU|nr:hypothetical protein [Amycolatopsis rubida]SFQ31615.1 hypothetical protein SAMN05421854_110250 [Amycolatopsis rubida]
MESPDIDWFCGEGGGTAGCVDWVDALASVGYATTREVALTLSLRARLDAQRDLVGRCQRIGREG